MFIVYEYIKYCFRAKGLFGIHSPFVTSFIKKVLKNHINPEEVQYIKEYQAFLKGNHQIIAVNDFGAGSKKLSNERSVAEIYSIGSSRKKYGRLLYNVAKFQKSKNILELGTSLGFGTLHLFLGNNTAKITTVEGCANTFSFTKQNFPLSSKIEFVNLTFKEYISKQLLSSEPFDLVFIDGHHDGDFLKSYISLIEEKIHNDTMIVIDDIRWSRSMFSAWSELIKKEEYHISIDLFRMGILMKKPDQSKEHFVLKY